jgi:hypothetical protein
VRLVVNRVGVDARPGFRLGGEDFLDGFTHRGVKLPYGWCFGNTWGDSLNFARTVIQAIPKEVRDAPRNVDPGKCVSCIRKVDDDPDLLTLKHF